jgi:hypothetical protein
MEIQIDNSLFLILSLLFLLLLPSFHLFIIFSLMGFGEWFSKLVKKILDLLTNLYDIIMIIISNPIILIGLLIYLCMSIT